MHGVGAPFVAAAFESFGLPPFIPVEQQCEPDPSFPTVREHLCCL
jgi:phosphomannomutase